MGCDRTSPVNLPLSFSRQLPALSSVVGAGLIWGSIAVRETLSLSDPLFRIGVIGILGAGIWSAVSFRPFERKSRTWGIGLSLWAVSPCLLILAVSYEASLTGIPDWSRSLLQTARPIFVSWVLAQCFASWWAVPLLALRAHLTFRQGAMTPAVLSWSILPITILVLSTIH